MYSGDEFYGDEITSPTFRPIAPRVTMTNYKRMTVTYGASKSLRGGWMPCVFIDGQPTYVIAHNAKSERGAISKAKAAAENTLAARMGATVRPHEWSR